MQQGKSLLFGCLTRSRFEFLSFCTGKTDDRFLFWNGWNCNWSGKCGCRALNPANVTSHLDIFGLVTVLPLVIVMSDCLHKSFERIGTGKSLTISTVYLWSLYQHLRCFDGVWRQILFARTGSVESRCLIWLWIYWIQVHKPVSGKEWRIGWLKSSKNLDREVTGLR